MDEISKKTKMLLFAYSFAANVSLFLLSIAFYNCVYATNDDYRMSLIVSGAYTGEPSDTLVFMKYPIAFLLSSLYKITAAVPWYGIATMLCIFVPACIICYFTLLEAKKGGHLVIGFLMYLLFYLFIVQKHVVLPQFTITAAFMAVAWLMLLWYMPRRCGLLHILCIGIFAAVSFSIRMKVFMMIAPVAVLIVAVKLLKERFADKKYILKYVMSVLLIIVLCGASLVCDNAHLHTEYKEFNTARSLVYDFGALPSYELHKEFYDENGIDESIFYSISARYLDFDQGITTETMRSIADYIKQSKNNTTVAEKLIESFFAVPTFFFQTGVLYQTIFVLILLVFAVFATVRKKKCFLTAIVLCTGAGMFLEMTYLCYISRVMDRLTEVCLLTVAVIGMLALNSVLSEKSKKKKTSAGNSPIWMRICRTASVVCMLTVGLCMIVANQNAVSAKAENQNKINSRLNVLNELAADDKNAFYFYDSYDFIAASSDVFAVYNDMVNTDSLGNWYINSPDYFKRNEKYGITNSIDGLIDGNKNIYYAAIGNLKNGVTYTLKERYNMEPVIVRTVPYANNNIYIYTFVPCD